MSCALVYHRATSVHQSPVTHPSHTIKTKMDITVDCMHDLRRDQKPLGRTDRPTEAEQTRVAQTGQERNKSALTCDTSMTRYDSSHSVQRTHANQTHSHPTILRTISGSVTRTTTSRIDGLTTMIVSSRRPMRHRDSPEEHAYLCMPVLVLEEELPAPANQQLSED